MSVDQLHEFLQEKHPGCFSKPWKPLAVGIREQIKKEHPEIPSSVLGEYLTNFCNGSKYLKAVVEAGPGSARVNLDGSVAGIVDTLQWLSAVDRLSRHKYADASFADELMEVLKNISLTDPEIYTRMINLRREGVLSKYFRSPHVYNILMRTEGCEYESACQIVDEYWATLIINKLSEGLTSSCVAEYLSWSKDRLTSFCQKHTINLPPYLNKFERRKAALK